jgi:hypothetical protein
MSNTKIFTMPKPPPWEPIIIVKRTPIGWPPGTVHILMSLSYMSNGFTCLTCQKLSDIRHREDHGEKKEKAGQKANRYRPRYGARHLLSRVANLFTHTSN